MAAGLSPRLAAIVDALPRIRAALVPGGTLLVDGGDPLREIPLD
ncbi:hypothetical protein [Ornithinimicrobium faecis]|nr:hypothetical protein [Ornithinimicrobium sp. HY1745]